MKVKPFEDVRNQIGYCGIWCGSCVVGNGTLRELTKRYEEIIKGYGLEEWAPKDFDFKEFSKGLASIRDMPLCRGCLRGDGNPNCQIRACALKNNVEDCAECDRPTECDNVERLQRMRTGALDAGLMVKTEKVVREKLIERWTTELRRRWPSCILFSDNQ